MLDTDNSKIIMQDKIGIEYFDKKDACKIANVSSKTIDNYVKKKIISVKRYENKNYYSLSDIEKLRTNVLLNKKSIDKEELVNIKDAIIPKDILNNSDKSKGSNYKKSANEIDKLRRIIDDYAEENATLTKQLNKMTLAMELKDSELNQKGITIEALRKELSGLQAEIAVLTAQVDEKKQVISELRRDNLSLNEEILKAQADIVELTTTRNNAKEAFNNLVGEIKGIVEEASNKNSEIAELRVYKANYLQVLAKVAKLEKERKVEHDEEVRRLIEVNCDLSTKCDKLMKQADQYQMLILDKVESKRLSNEEYNSEKKATFKDKLKDLFKK